MTIDSKKFRIACKPDICQKSAVVLHFTAGGSVGGAVEWWKQKGFGTAYIVDREGLVYEVFDPQKWLYHLGADVASEKRTIGIELVNWGPLDIDAQTGKFRSWAKQEIPAGDVGEKVYRGKRYWQKFPEAQVAATNQLTKLLCKQFGIPPVIPGADWRDEFVPHKAVAFRGVLTHANFSKGKYDIGPMWDWARTRETIR